MLAKGLREESYVVDVVGDGEQAVYQAAIIEYDAIILDVVLPIQDGLAVCRAMRREGSSVPVVMLTARDAVEARIAGLDSGADDYLTKPFDFGELLARLRAVIRRGQRPVRPSIIEVGPLRLDTRARRASRREYALLEHLAMHAEEVVGRASIAEHVWDTSYEAMSNAIDVCVQRLRRKIDDADQRSLIVTRRGEGYMLSVADDRAAEPA